MTAARPVNSAPAAVTRAEIAPTTTEKSTPPPPAGGAGAKVVGGTDGDEVGTTVG
jgi:hypothetical protein